VKGVFADYLHGKSTKKWQGCKSEWPERDSRESKTTGMAAHRDRSARNNVFASEYAEKSAFASTVGADQQNSAATLDAYRNIAKHWRQLVLVDLRQALKKQNKTKRRMTMQ
jgi:hypothetical protein